MGNTILVVDDHVALDQAPGIVLTSSHDRAEVDALVPASGACGFVPKSELSREAIEELL